LKKIHVIAPSGANPEPQSPFAAIEWFKRQGFEVQNTDCVERRYQRFSGKDAERLSELNQIGKLSGEHLVLAMRGGYGLHRLLPDIEWQQIANAIQNGLQVCGHSDFTVFQLGLLAKTGAVSLAGPMLNYDFEPKESKAEIIPDPLMWKHFQAAIQDRQLDCKVEAQQSYLGKSTAGELTGTLWGGNLTILCSLVGTPYFPALSFQLF
jgi:muramoyltetrapeptide carboxypeptidase